MNVLLAKTDEVNVLIDAVVEWIESNSSKTDAVKLLAEEVNVYKLWVACNNAFVLTTIPDADNLRDDADTNKLPLSVSNKFNLEVWVLFVLNAVDAELCKAVTYALVEDVYELKLFLILPLAVSKLDILTFEAAFIAATDELNTLVTDAPDELRFKVVCATLPLNTLIELLNEAVLWFIKLATDCV